MPTRIVLIFTLVLAQLISASPPRITHAAPQVTPDVCQPQSLTYGSLRITKFSTACYSLTPHYWKNGITMADAKKELQKKNIGIVAVTTGGFNTGVSWSLEPVDLLEIEGHMYRDRNELWPILYETRNETGETVLGVTYLRAMLPRHRRWALASGPWIRVVDQNHKGEPVSPTTIQIFGNEILNELFNNPWVTLSYPNGNILKTKTRWDAEERRLVFDTTSRRAVFLNQKGDVFAVVEGSSDALGLTRAMVAIGFYQTLMMDGGSSTTPSAKNPAYLVVTKK